MNNREQTAYNSQEANRKTANQIREGVIFEARYDTLGHPDYDPDNVPEWFSNESRSGEFRQPLYRVEIGDHKTNWIPHISLRAGGDIDYWAYEVGEKVVVLAPNGDPNQSFIIGSMYNDEYRPPVGHDDLSGEKLKDKRPWRESVHRTRYRDNYLVEYDRYLHRKLHVFNDGTKFEFWFLDDREDRTPRNKETNSDKQNVPPRHWEHRAYSDGLDYEILWDEDTKIHRRHYQWPDGAGFEYQWDEQNKTHSHHWTMADGTDYQYFYDEQNKLHRQHWQWPDGYSWEYKWDEQAQTHHETTVYADGTQQRYHYDEGGDYHIDETSYSDGTTIRYHYNDPHKHEILYADGSSIVYNLQTSKLTGTFVGEVDVLAEGNVLVQTQKNCDVAAMQNITADAKQNVQVNAGENASISAKNIKADASENLVGSAGKQVTFKAETITLDAKSIQLKGSVSMGTGKGGSEAVIDCDVNVKGNMIVEEDVKARNYL
ncbi:phage baseplate assembly protein V [Candidatus Albibeggiatoa sp. nov. NOAA]|uniref:phage baseplate assembly protein V n=1 Tax=Candidatus Albibeggiatoa sp. nov. NOAA TaxID=3162724 RepID=UPI0032FEA4F5|nr:phage baseplate assembly protein V [Thiotrichaceae bacterium]